MKALAIIALTFAGLSIFIPIGGVFIAMLCSVLAMISFRSQPTLSGITFGLNIINTAFLSPSILMTDFVSSDGAMSSAGTSTITPTDPGDIYFAYVGFHIVLLVIAGIWRLVRGAPKQTNSAA